MISSKWQLPGQAAAVADGAAARSQSRLLRASAFDGSRLPIRIRPENAGYISFFFVASAAGPTAGEAQPEGGAGCLTVAFRRCGSLFSKHVPKMMRLALLAALFACGFHMAAGHGYLAEPPARNSPSLANTDFCPQCLSAGGAAGLLESLRAAVAAAAGGASCRPSCPIEQCQWPHLIHYHCCMQALPWSAVALTGPTASGGSVETPLPVHCGMRWAAAPTEPERRRQCGGLAMQST